MFPEIMDSKTLKKLHATQLIIAKEIKEICDRNDISYFLDSGTLLGAVRHKGFIPWDDDIDIGMTRENYELFIKLAQNELGENYFVQNWYTDKYFGKPFTKICANGTKYIEKGTQNINIHHGVFVDIIPYDKAPTQISEIDSLRKKLERIRSLLLLRGGYYSERSLLFKIGRLFSLLIPKFALINLYNRAVKGAIPEIYTDYYAHTGTTALCTWKMPKEVVEELEDILFEGYVFKGAKNWDLYLKQAYGDYMELPDVSKRLYCHDVVELLL